MKKGTGHKDGQRKIILATGKANLEAYIRALLLASSDFRHDYWNFLNPQVPINDSQYLFYSTCKNRSNFLKTPCNLNLKD